MLILIGVVLLIWNIIVFRYFCSPDRNKNSVWYEDRINFWQEVVRVSPLLPETFSSGEVEKNTERVEFWKETLAKEIWIIRTMKRITFATMIFLDVVFVSYLVLTQ